MAVTLEKFVQQLEDSGIVASDALKDFIPPKASPKDAEDLAKELIRQKKLTKFQAEEVSKGKGKSLTLGNYVLMEKIGAGGMGQVFKARHRRMDRLVAVKLLPSAMTKDKTAIARFEREVKAAAKLRHPNIVADDDADCANDVHFLVMECVEGCDLSAMVKKNGPFSLAQAVNCILQTARGLEFAHNEGVVHRDIKPANLLLDKKGTVKILDMGLARLHGDGDGPQQADLTSTGTIMGTVDYMAPEQALDTKSADARADIYALGCSLYYLLTGKSTYDGDTLMKKLLAHREDPIPALRLARAEVPESLEQIFQKMVAKKVEHRYQKMSEVIAQLERVNVSESATVATPPSDATIVFSGDLKLSTQTQATQTSHKTQATVPLPVTASGPGNRKTIIAIGAAVLFGAVLLAGVVFSLKTKDGTLVVEVDQHDAVLQVDDGETIQITQKDGTDKITIRVDPGKHRLKVEKDGFMTYGQEFEMKKNGTRTIAAKLVPIDKATIPVPAVVGTPNATEASKPIDLLKLIDPKKNARLGSWRIEDGALVSGQVFSILSVPYIPPANYRLTVVASRIGAQNPICVGLSIGTQRITAEVDSWDGKVSGFSGINGESITVLNSEVQNQSRFKAGVSATISCTVRDGSAEFSFDGQVVAKTPPATRLSLTPIFAKENLAPLFLATVCDYRITKLELLPLNAGDPGFAIAKLDTYIDSDFLQWMSDVTSLTAENKVDAVARKLRELNPGFDGQMSPRIEGGTVKELSILADRVTDISPVRAFSELQVFNCRGSDRKKGRLWDLSPLIGMKLAKLDCSNTNVFDVSAIENLPLTEFDCENTPIASLSPLRALHLTKLDCSQTSLASLSSLKGLPLTNLNCSGTAVSDLPSLQGMKLTSLICDHVLTYDLTLLRTMPLKTVSCDLKLPRDTEILRSIKTLENINNKPAGEFWKDVDAKEASVQKWIKSVSTMSVEMQHAAVKKRLMELNPDFDGNFTTNIEEGVVVALNIRTTKVSDISPLRGFVGLKELDCSGNWIGNPENGILSDLSPLKWMKVTKLKTFGTQVTDFSWLQGTPLTSLECGQCGIVDLSSLKGVPITSLNIAFSAITDLTPLKGMPFTELFIFANKISDLSPLEGMPLVSLQCCYTDVTDLSPLEGMNLKDFRFTPKNITRGIEIIRKMKSLEIVGLDPKHRLPVDEFWKLYDAGEFGKP